MSNPFAESLDHIDKLLADEEVPHEAKMELRQAFDAIGRAWGIHLGEQKEQLARELVVTSDTVRRLQGFSPLLRGLGASNLLVWLFGSRRFNDTH